MAYIILAPLLVLFMIDGIAGCAMSFVTFLVIGTLINKLHAKGFYGKSKPTFWDGCLIIAVAIYGGCTFYARWLSASEIASIAGMLGLSVPMLVGAVSVLLSGLSVCSMCWLLYDIKKIFSGAACLPDLNKRLAQVDRLEIKLDRTDWRMCALLALGSAIILCGTCPLFKLRPASDSSLFLYIGREMLRGKIPYVDLFDHKGILLYFIECAGVWLSFPGTYSGIWLIELTGLFMTAVFFYKTIRLMTDSKHTGYLVLLTMMFTYISIYYEGGNLSEAYALPWITMAVYVYLKFFMTMHYYPVEIAALGAGCAAVAFLRVNMVSVWIAFTPLVLFFLLKERRYKEVFRCSGCFIGGFAAVCIPVGLYCLLTDSMGSMIKYSILFNMQYTESMGSAANRIQTALVLMHGFCLIPIILASILYKRGDFSHKARELFWLNMWGFAVSLLLATISGRAYNHYGLVLVPFFAVPVSLTVQSIVNYLKQTSKGGEDTKTHAFSQRPDRTIAAAACLIVLIISLPKEIKSVRYKEYRESDPVIKYLSTQTDESDDVLIIGNACRYYLESGRRTDNKFFNQFPAVTASDALYNEFVKEITDHPSDVVLFTQNDDGLKKIYDQWCEEGKYAYEEVGSFPVYRLQET